MNTDTQQYELYPEQFYCPKCFIKRPYKVKPVSVKVSFYYIPLFENDDLPYVVECKACKKGFDPRILRSTIQSLIKMAGAARREIIKGTPPEILKEGLVSVGLNDELAHKLILLMQI